MVPSEIQSADFGSVANKSEFFSLNHAAYHSVQRTFIVRLKKELPPAQYWFRTAPLGIKEWSSAYRKYNNHNIPNATSIETLSNLYPYIFRSPGNGLD